MVLPHDLFDSFEWGRATHHLGAILDNMSWLAQIIATIGLFLSSLLGTPSVPVLGASTTPGTTALVPTVGNITASSTVSCAHWAPITIVQSAPIHEYSNGYSQGYFRYKDTVYWTDSYHVEELPPVDFASFRSNQYGDLAKDNNHVFSEGGILQGADPGSFQELCTETGGRNACYVKDKDEVIFFCGIDSPYPVRGADAASFKVVNDDPTCISNCFDAYDKYHKYWGGNPID